MTVLIRLLTLALITVFSATGCATRDQAAKPKQAARTQEVPTILLVGTIALVNSESGFVLIDQGQQAAPVTGALLKTYSGPAESAVLVASDVRKRPFIIADIKSGAPQKGDRVYLPNIVPAQLATSPTAPAVASSGAALEELPQLSEAGVEDQ